MSIITATDISKTYPRGREEVCALRGVNIAIEPGEFVSIVGPSGAGKTALMNILGCLDAPTGGKLAIDGIDVIGKKEAELVKIRREHIGFVFQQFFLIPTLTVGENTGLPLIFSGRPYDRQRIESLLGKVGLSHRADHLPGQLSGGEMQRVAIARALVNNPRILLADEPTGNLDSVTADGIYRLFDELHKQGITVIVVTHNRELAQRAGRVITLRDGCVVNMHTGN
jgi:putative ABC transport system ATP-binding protein